MSMGKVFLSSGSIKLVVVDLAKVVRSRALRSMGQIYVSSAKK